MDGHPDQHNTHNRCHEFGMSWPWEILKWSSSLWIKGWTSKQRPQRKSASSKHMWPWEKAQAFSPGWGRLIFISLRNWKHFMKFFRCLPSKTHSLVRAWKGLDEEKVDGLDVITSSLIPMGSSLVNKPMSSSLDLTSEPTNLSPTI